MICLLVQPHSLILGSCSACPVAIAYRVRTSLCPSTGPHGQSHLPACHAASRQASDLGSPHTPLRLASQLHQLADEGLSPSRENRYLYSDGWGANQIVA